MSWYAKNARLVCALLNRRSRRDPHRESIARRKRLGRKFRAILTLLYMSYREGGKVKKRALSKTHQASTGDGREDSRLPSRSRPRRRARRKAALKRTQCEFGIFEALRGPIRLLPRTVCRAWRDWFPAIRMLGASHIFGRRDAAGRRPKPMPCSPTNAASKLTVGPKSSIGGIAAL